MSKRRKKVFISLGAIMLLLISILLFMNWNKITDGKPTLMIETPQKISLSQTEEVVLDVTISKLKEDIYPAASMSISFDSARLEFLGVEEGNVFIHNNQLPEWSCNVEQSNKNGVINIIYLDTTGGKNAFSQEFLADEDNVVLRLNFLLRGSIRSGDVCDLIFDDAIFANSDEEKSLAMSTGTLKVRNGKLVMGD